MVCVQPGLSYEVYPEGELGRTTSRERVRLFCLFLSSGGTFSVPTNKGSLLRIDITESEMILIAHKGTTATVQRKSRHGFAEPVSTLYRAAAPANTSALFFLLASMVWAPNKICTTNPYCYSTLCYPISFPSSRIKFYQVQTQPHRFSPLPV